MSVSVQIDTGISEMTFGRPTVHGVSQSRRERYRQAANVLRSIAEDIDRMYPPALSDDKGDNA